MEQDIRKILAITRENNEILRAIERRNKRASFFTFLRWIVIVAVLLGAYVYVEPYVQNLKNAYISASQTIQDIGHAADTVKSAVE